MCKRLGNSRWLLAVGLSVGLSCAGQAFAAATPMVMGPLYVEPKRDATHPAPADAAGCPVRIVDLSDPRRAPETIGSWVTFRALQAPADRMTWLRSVFEVGLAARGFKPSFGPPADSAAPSNAVSASIRLKAIWISTMQMNKVGSVAVQMSAAPSGAAPGPMKVYRGDESGLNWAGSTGEFNGLVNRVFADAMDDMAQDLLPLCTAAAKVANN